MAPLFNTTLVCNTTASCAKALDKTAEKLEDFQRLSCILGSLFGIALILLLCSPLILNLPRDCDDNYGTRSPPTPPPENDEIEMRNLENPREMPHPDQFVVDPDEEPGPHSTQSTFVDPGKFREVEVDGERFHVSNSEATILAETGVFRGAGDERVLARSCVEGAPAPSVAGEGEYGGAYRNSRIGNAV